ncbi:hypothetical protein P152DRAFT_506943 [Eremomyces bilateralis CBS 781.70]|uniref:BZIP domain-containing protein n=1 Tax=Eremomyces bilateralis CBS 781.70 TaxID=1392243 RepID=A0A6G1G5K6_9PEZI|nr:uncharacterized protein P152DRAFT_506943 [Eremomyces bilateralis CBS 781.70]KAF1813343.1 hypothetical protein P152DRAFT_506943 [Eremomyces bilateralis CBS 781.70]
MESQSYDYWISQGAYTAGSTPVNSPQDYVSYAPRMSYPASFDPALPMYTVPPFGPVVDELASFNYGVGVTPSEMSSADESSYQCSPRMPIIESAYSPQTGKSHATSGRRRAQNRAAQRAFRERKEKHARDLEGQLAALTEQYNTLESDHAELSAAYEKLRRTIEVLTKDDTEDHPPSNADRLRRLLGILHGEVKKSSATGAAKQQSE